MSKVETISLRIFGRDLTIACPPKEKNNLIKAANLLNEELDGINDKNNALIIAGLISKLFQSPKPPFFKICRTNNLRNLPFGPVKFFHLLICRISSSDLRPMKNSQYH